MPYNVADAARDIDDLIVRPAHVFKEKQGIDVRIEHRVEAIDPSSKTVTGRTRAGEPFEVPYDKLLIATGARPVLPELPGIESPGVMALKNLEDGRKIKAFIKNQDVKKALIIGMGYIAFEMCEAFRARDIEVEMIKPRPVFIPWMNEELASIVKEEIEANHVKVHLGQPIESIEKMRAKGFDLQPGDFAENLTTEGIELYTLPLGTKIKVGNDVLLEVTQIGKTCLAPCAIYHAVGDCVMPKEGIFVRVLSEGTINIGDEIVIC